VTRGSFVTQMWKADIELHIRVLGLRPEDYDVGAIMRNIRDVHGFVDVEEISVSEFQALVARHERVSEADSG
jgi:hypothetical protein